MVKTIARKVKFTLTEMCLSHLDNVVLDYITKHPNSRCFEIAKATLKTHHNWGTKFILDRLERDGKIGVFKYRLEYNPDGEVITVKDFPKYFAW